MAGRSMDPNDRRSQIVTVRLSPREKALFEGLAGGITIAAWLREAGLEKASQETGYMDSARRQTTRRPNRQRDNNKGDKR
jgi:hypothetical protein